MSLDLNMPPRMMTKKQEPSSKRNLVFNPVNGNVTFGKSYGEYSFNGLPAHYEPPSEAGPAHVDVTKQFAKRTIKVLTSSPSARRKAADVVAVRMRPLGDVLIVEPDRSTADARPSLARSSAQKAASKSAAVKPKSKKSRRIATR